MYVTWGKPLTGRYAHWCVEWDDLAIDETCSEFEHCICFKDKDEIIKYCDCEHPLENRYMVDPHGSVYCDKCNSEISTQF